jgi:hypothetical protein
MAAEYASYLADGTQCPSCKHHTVTFKLHSPNDYRTYGFMCECTDCGFSWFVGAKVLAIQGSYELRKKKEVYNARQPS